MNPAPTFAANETTQRSDDSKLTVAPPAGASLSLFSAYKFVPEAKSKKAEDQIGNQIQLWHGLVSTV